jgi:glycosyltransferase involved in cell wall biosynthesis
MRVDNRIPDLAVIIPAYNEAQRIGGCIDSIREALEYAEVTDAEVIVVDDESADDTSDVARAHGAVALRQSRRQGPLAAWTRGVADSSASLLCFVDADCRVDKAAFAALLAGFARPTVGVAAARAELDSRRTGNSMVERSATFSALILHEIKSRLDNDTFMPIGRMMAVRRAAWQKGDHRWPCDLVMASRAKEAGWEISYRPDAVVYYQPVGTYKELRSDFLRTRIGQALLGDLVKPLPRGVVGRAAFATLRRQPLNAAAWLALRALLWSERSRGRLRLDEGYARWDRHPENPQYPTRSTQSHRAPEEQTGSLA